MNNFRLHRQLRREHRFLPNPLSLAVTLALASANAAHALPTGEEIVAGQVATSRPDARNLVVQQRTPKAIVNWSTFSIQGNEGVTFQQPNQSAVILNRVTGSSPSDIFGTLKSNGNVFLVNPNGILFGPSASIQVGGLVASTLGISNEDFLAGKYQFGSTTPGATVKNQGNITTRDNGVVALLGGKVENDGTVHARLGTSAMAAGGKVTLDFSDDGLTKIRVDQAAVDAQIRNGGMVVADGGQVVMTVAAAEALGRTVVNQQGIVRATSVSDRTGKVVIDGGASGVTLVSGTVDASGANANEKGGEIHILGQHVGLVDRAQVNASGNQGGGTVLVGGSFQGKGPQIRNAEATFVARDAEIHADAITNGKGGNVVVWGNEATRAHGTISVQGGAASGDGGAIETSGKFLDTSGIRVLAGAPMGKAGDWLLDPFDITIQHGNSNSSQDVGSAPTFASQGTFSVLTDSALADALNNHTNVTVTTGPGGQDKGDVDVKSGVVISKTSGADTTLQLSAHNDIIVSQNVSITSQPSTGLLHILLNSDSDNDGRGAIWIGQRAKGGDVNIQTNGGNVSLLGGRDPFPRFLDGVDRGRHVGSATDSGVQLGDSRAPIQGRVSIDTTGPSNTSGLVVIGGVSAASSAGRWAGVLFENASITTSSGAITIIGDGRSGGTGIELIDTKIDTTSGGTIHLLGVSDGLGVEVVGSALTTHGAPGVISITGVSTSSFAGVRLDANSRIGDAAMTGDVVFRALSNGERDVDSIELHNQVGSIQTAGAVSFAPSDLGLKTLEDQPISLDPDGLTSYRGFSLSAAELRTVALGPGSIVVGSETYTGQIAVTGPLSLNANLTLQNTGVGSHGISISGPITNSGGNVTLNSAGPVLATPGSRIAAQGLALLGVGNAKFELKDNVNSVSDFAALTSKGGIRLINDRELTLKPISSLGFSSALQQATPIDFTTFGSEDHFFVRTLAGDLILDPDIRTTASGSNIDLVAAGVFKNPVAGGLFPGAGGRWRIWADTWRGGNPGGLAGSGDRPNWYNCAFPGPCGPAEGNRFIYEDQPRVTIRTPDRTIQFGTSIPSFPGVPDPAIPDGLVNGDKTGKAVQGGFQTAATATSEPGKYSVTGSFVSPVGYEVTVLDGNLTITPGLPDPRPDCKNCTNPPLGPPSLNMCTASGPLLIRLQDPPPDAKTVDTEWTRVRTRLNLGNCLGVNPRAACDDF